MNLAAKASIIAIVSIFSIAVQAQAGPDLAFSLQIIDEKAKPGDLFEYKVEIKNLSEQRVEAYAFVRDISATSTGVPNPEGADRTSSLASWISFRRSVITLDPGSAVTLPLSIKVSPHAVAGIYHTEIVLAKGSNLQDAESRSEKEYAPRIFLRTEVGNTEVERAEITKFAALKSVFLNPPYNISLQISNAGTLPVSPKGYFRVFDRRGSEVSEIPFDAGELNPGEIRDYAEKLPDSFGPGRYKVKTVLDYGSLSSLVMEDLAEFWIFPKSLAVSAASGFFFFILLFLFICPRRPSRNRAPVDRRKKSATLNLR